MPKLHQIQDSPYFQPVSADMLFRYKALNTVCIEAEVQRSRKGVEKETEKSIQIIRLSTISGFILVQWLLMPSSMFFSLFLETWKNLSSTGTSQLLELGRWEGIYLYFLGYSVPSNFWHLLFLEKNISNSMTPFNMEFCVMRENVGPKFPCANQCEVALIWQRVMQKTSLASSAGSAWMNPNNQDNLLQRSSKLSTDMQVVLSSKRQDKWKPLHHMGGFPLNWGTSRGSRQNSLMELWGVREGWGADTTSPQSEATAGPQAEHWSEAQEKCQPSASLICCVDPGEVT